MTRSIYLATAIVLIGALTVFSTSGSAMAAPDVISMDSVEIGVGATGTVALRASDVEQPGIAAWTIDIQYDPAVVSVLSCEVPIEAGVCSTAFAADTLRVTGASDDGLPDEATLAVYEFRCADVEGVTELAIEIVVLSRAVVGFEEVDATIENGSITCVADEPAAEPTAEPSASPPTLPATGGGGTTSSVWPLATAVLALAGTLLLGGALRLRRRV